MGCGGSKKKKANKPEGADGERDPGRDKPLATTSGSALESHNAAPVYRAEYNTRHAGRSNPSVAAPEPPPPAIPEPSGK